MTEADRTRPDQAPASKAGSFRIGSALVVIAMIAVALGVMRASLPLGIYLAAWVIPAAILTGFAASRRRTEGRPMGLNEVLRAFIMSLLGCLVVLISASIAFCVTCVPISLMGMHGEFQIDNTIMIIAVTFGGLAALGAGSLVAMGLLKAARRRQARDRERGEP